MKQKYHIWKNIKGKTLLIREYAVLNEDTRKQRLPGVQDEDFSLLCEQSYNAEAVKEATSKGKDELVSLLRNRHFFPIGLYMDKIVESVIAMYKSKGEQYKDLIFDDKDALFGNLAEVDTVTEIEEDTEFESSNNINNLIEDDIQYNGNNSTKTTNHEQYNEEENY